MPRTMQTGIILGVVTNTLCSMRTLPRERRVVVDQGGYD